MYMWMQVPMEARGVGFPLELGYWWLSAVQCGCWGLNLGPVLEHDIILLQSHLFSHYCLTILIHFLRVFTDKSWRVKLIANYVVFIQIWDIVVIVAPLAWRYDSSVGGNVPLKWPSQQMGRLVYHYFLSWSFVSSIISYFLKLTVLVPFFISYWFSF